MKIFYQYIMPLNVNLFKCTIKIHKEHLKIIFSSSIRSQWNSSLMHWRQLSATGHQKGYKKKLSWLKTDMTGESLAFSISAIKFLYCQICSFTFIIQNCLFYPTEDCCNSCSCSLMMNDYTFAEAKITIDDRRQNGCPHKLRRKQQLQQITLNNNSMYKGKNQIKIK